MYPRSPVIHDFVLYSYSILMYHGDDDAKLLKHAVLPLRCLSVFVRLWLLLQVLKMAFNFFYFINLTGNLFIFSFSQFFSSSSLSARTGASAALRLELHLKKRRLLKTIVGKTDLIINTIET